MAIPESQQKKPNGAPVGPITSKLAPIQLVPMDLHESDQFNTLQAQRQDCGWNHETDVLESIRKSMDARDRTMFWIVPAKPSASTSIPPENVRTDVPIDLIEPSLAGHISLDHPTPSEAAGGFGTATLDGHTMKISWLYITPSFRGQRIADSAIALLEDLACQSPYGNPSCTNIVVDTISRQYTYDEGPDGKGIWARMGLPLRTFSTQDWFRGKGYVKYASRPRYRNQLLDGTPYTFTAVYSRKVLRRESDV